MKSTIKLSELLKKLFVKSKKQNTETLPSSATFDVKVDYANGNDQTKQEEAKDDGGGEDRQTWDSPMEFLMSCISMSVGLGNVWRFPFTAYENGGDAFLIPYLLVLLLIGRYFFL